MVFNASGTDGAPYNIIPVPWHMEPLCATPENLMFNARIDLKPFLSCYSCLKTYVQKFSLRSDENLKMAHGTWNPRVPQHNFVETDRKQVETTVEHVLVAN